MQDKTISILSTRPLDESLVQKAMDKNIIIDEISFIQIENNISAEIQNQINKLSQQPATVVFTSMNAVEVLVNALPVKANIPDWEIYCISGATFSLIKKYWPCGNVVATAKNAAELSKQITAGICKEVYFFCGNKRREELPERLRQQGLQVYELTIYNTVEIPVKVEKNYDVILFFSPSAVHSFFTKNKVETATKLFAIGETTANTIRGFCNNEIVISDFPAKEQMVEQAIGCMNYEL